MRPTSLRTGPSPRHCAAPCRRSSAARRGGAPRGPGRAPCRQARERPCETSVSWSASGSAVRSLVTRCPQHCLNTALALAHRSLGVPAYSCVAPPSPTIPSSFCHCASSVLGATTIARRTSRLSSRPARKAAHCSVLPRPCYMQEKTERLSRDCRCHCGHAAAAAVNHMHSTRTH